MAPGNDSKTDSSQLPRFISDLLKPEAYPHPVTRLELRQTHISYVLLTGPFAYKIKKPVNFGFLDYSTLEKRRFFCHEEVRLNARLCPEIYLGVAEIGLKNGHAQIGGGEIIEYAVKMIQLPEDRIMDSLLTTDSIDPSMMEELAYKLADYYHRARTGPEVNKYGEPRLIRVNTDENFAQTLPYVGRTLTQQEYDLIRRYTERFLQHQSSLFRQRIAGGWIREGHGDLRAGNICFASRICIFDCIEFNERFRCGDVAADIAFLSMDLDASHRPDLSRCFLDAYIDASGDIGIGAVLTFYKVYRAYVRGKVESFKIDEPEISAQEKQRSLAAARAYFDLALRYVSESGGQNLVDEKSPEAFEYE